MPLRETVAVLAMVEEVTVSEPVSAPVAAGEKTTPTVQFEPAARFAEQVLWVRANPAVTVRVSWAAAKLLVLLTVTVCAALVEPATVAGKVTCTGAAFRPEAANPAPFKVTVAGVSTPLAAMVNRAESGPAAVGVNVTWTVQLPPAASEDPQVAAVHGVAPQEKLDA